MTDLKPQLIGVNHIALEVGDIDEALAFYGAIFRFELRGRSEGMAFIDMGDQFIALSQGRSQAPDQERHFGLVVDDREGVPELVEKAGGTMLDTPFMDFLDPWGNHIQVVNYRDLQFTKTDAVMQAIGADPSKTAAAKDELIKKGMA